MWILGLIGLLSLVFLGALFITFRQNPVLMRFVPHNGLPSGYSWTLSEGPDFDVYYAQRATDKTAGVGLYLGNMPNFFYDENENIVVDDLLQEKGRLLSRDVTWIVEDQNNLQGHTFFRETQFEYFHGVGFLYTEVHIWVCASNQEGIDELVEGLDTLQLKPMASFLGFLAYRMGWR